MGVTGLWTVVQPCARPTNISTLNRKRLAVDASIWIYQFLKAVRDKEGNALRNSHVVGFFRRICKLLFHGIKPVFIFDGGAPALKRATITARKRRREGRREDAVRTAGKLLAVQMQRKAEEEAQKRREESAGHPTAVQEEELPEHLVYVDQLNMTPQERKRDKAFKKKDQYHLPDLDVSLAEMGAPNDPRIMSLEELQQYARQFDRGEDINVYDFSKIDFDSQFFTSLPASDRYNILNAARLRSRLRMGYSKEQLDVMFPNRMEFSRFQIERVRERNELTQRLMHINGMNGDDWMNTSGRIAGEKGREYVLVKNEGVEGGWALGVVTSKDEGQRNKPIDVDEVDEVKSEDEVDEMDEDEEFEDVPVEGLNRLPIAQKAQNTEERMAERSSFQRRRLYDARQAESRRTRTYQKKPRTSEPDSLFVAEASEDEEQHLTLAGEDESSELQVYGTPDNEEEELQRAIALSLLSGKESRDDLESDSIALNTSEVIDIDDDHDEAFGQQVRVEDPKPFSHGSALAIARMANARSSKAIVTTQSDSEEDNDVDLQAALFASKKANARIGVSDNAVSKAKIVSPNKLNASSNAIAGNPTLFDGPLPFEKIDFGTSFLSKKKPKADKDTEGGFVKSDGDAHKRKDATPPPWFSTEARDGLSKQKVVEQNFRDLDRQHDEQFHFQPSVRPTRHEIIEVDADESLRNTRTEVIVLDADGDTDTDADANNVDEDNEKRSEVIQTAAQEFTKTTDEFNIAAEDQKQIRLLAEDKGAHETSMGDPTTGQWSFDDGHAMTALSDQNERDTKNSPQSNSEEDNFEDVPFTDHPASHGTFLMPTSGPARSDEVYVSLTEPVDQERSLEAVEFDAEDGAADLYSDPEDEELFEQLLHEVEEHARFASTLNHKTTRENARDYEQELKQLRNQQKRDRRDADEVTQTMIAECQQLLSLFGLPYITAPMEAEAQCAELVRLGLVDGIVTDDSDIFLFGGTRVYKNMFNQAKFVECYLLSDLVSEFSLTREKLISIAQLLGSDYTEGLPGVGPVTALEIISEFGTLDAFRKWWDSVQNGTRSKAADQGLPFRRKFRKNATKLFLPAHFPDVRVTEAYMCPEVDGDATNFVWGIPDLDALREFLMATIGWNQERTDEILVPVIRDMNKRDAEGTQANITRFFSGTVGAGAFAPRQRAQGKSKRLVDALNKMAENDRETTTNQDTEETDAIDHQDDDDLSAPPAKRKKRAVRN